MLSLEQRAANIVEYNMALVAHLDQWVVACGGLEEPMHYNGGMWLYVYNPYRCQHGYLNLDDDIVYGNMQFEPLEDWRV